MFISLNDVDLFYRVVGAGDPALVMHGGLGADHTCFVNSGFNRLANSLELPITTIVAMGVLHVPVSRA